ncbi:MAG: NlpC/P60 family protein [Actinomycetota bacterium]|nr:NlpC/P60 family protein [Actinomycetota bacterium]
MHALTDTGRRIWRRITGLGPGRAAVSGHPVRGVIKVLIGVIVGAVLVTACGAPARVSGLHAVVPSSRAPQVKSTGSVVPLLGGNTEGRGKPMAVPVASAPAPASTTSARSAKVVPLHGLRQADLLVVAPFSLSGQVRASMARQPAVTSVVSIEAAKIKINGAYAAVLGVDPSTFRGYAARAMATSNPLWQGVADGGIAVSYTMGTLDRLSLGGAVTAAGRTQKRLPVVAFGTVGIGGVDAVVSDATARSLGAPASNAIVISAPPAEVASLLVRIKKVLPSGAAVEALVTQVTAGPSSAGLSSSTVTGGPGSTTAGLTTAQLTTALRAAESRRGLPYVWGASGPAAFDCSGLVQWSFAQAGVSMPRVAADQARTGLAVPVSRLEPGDLLFYHTDPTDPGYISHVAIYLGNGWMIQAPQPGMDVQLVPASLGSQFAGAIRVSPRIAAAVAAGLA